MPKHKIEFVIVDRDFGQAYYLYFKFNDPNLLKKFAIVNELAKKTTQDENSLFYFRKVEAGGAHPQSTVLYDNDDAIEPYREMALLFPFIEFRPLYRANSGFWLEPKSKAHHRHLITQLAEDLAHPALAGEGVESRIDFKLFDSQGRDEELKVAIDIIADLRKQNYLVSTECAIPYSRKRVKRDGKIVEIYPDEYYLKKVEDSYKRLAESGLPLHLCRISLKDMVGQLDAKTTERLLPKMIAKVQELQKNRQASIRQSTQNVDAIVPDIPIGLHLHDIGHAVASSVAAIKVCIEMDYPITLDVVDCDLYHPDFVDEQAWRNTGFASLRDINEALKKEGIDIGLDVYLEEINELAKLGLIIAQDYQARRVTKTLESGKLDQYEIPGGGMNSFSTAITNFNVKSIPDLSNVLQITELEAADLVGNTLKTVGEITGCPHPVTPGFQNKQLAALNLIKNWILADILVPGMKIEEMRKLVRSGAEKDDEEIKIPFTAEEIRNHFYKGLSVATKKFFKGEMPAETMRKQGIDTHIAVHPELRRLLEADESLKDSTTLTVKEAEDAINQLAQTSPNLVQPTATQINAIEIIHAKTDADTRKKIGIEKAKQTLITWLLIADNIQKFTNNLQQRWRHDPHPPLYKDDLPGYAFAYDRAKQGKNPEPDDLAKKFLALKQGRGSVKVLKQYKDLLLEKERNDIRLHVLNIVKQEMLQWSGESFQKRTTARIYEEQDKLIQDKAFKGERFYFKRERRLDIALTYFAQLIAQYENVKKERKKIEQSILVSPMPGVVKTIDAKKGDKVIANKTPVITLEAMKMDNTQYSSVDGIIESIAVLPGASVAEGTVLITINVTNQAEEKHNDSADVQFNVKEANKLIAAIEVHNKQLTQKINAAERDVLEAINTQKIPEPETQLEKCGFYAQPLTLTDAAKTHDLQKPEIHIILNRSVSALNTWSDLIQVGYDIRLLCIPEDRHCWLSQNIGQDKLIPVTSYTNHAEVLAALLKFAQQNPGATLWVHPGWGLLAEDVVFVAALEEMAKKHNINIIFVGPPSSALLQGGKGPFRDIVAAAAKMGNPPYFRHETVPASELQAYIASDFSKEHRLDSLYRHYYEEKVVPMREANKPLKVAIKADSGGGGFGIEIFTADDTKSDEENYRDFVRLVTKNVGYSEGKFQDGGMVTEKFIGGVTWHFEVQVAANDVSAEVIGARKCTPQKEGQKTNECNLRKGDFPQEAMNEMFKVAKDIIIYLQKDENGGYRGLGTIEFLVSVEKLKRWMELKALGKEIKPEDNFFFVLELNPRLQVEHKVTTYDWFLKNCKNVSLPLLLLSCLRKDGIAIRDVLTRDFGIDDGDRMKALVLADKRVDHIRLNSMKYSLPKGLSLPSYLWGYLFQIHPGIYADIAKRTGAQIVICDIGNGRFVSHTGTVWGESEAVVRAVQEILELVELACVCMDHNGTISADYVLQFRELIYDKNGAFMDNISTKTQDGLFKMINKGTIKLEFDYQALSTEPQLIPGSLQKAFIEYLEKTKQAEEALAAIATAKMQKQTLVFKN